MRSKRVRIIHRTASSKTPVWTYKPELDDVFYIPTQGSTTSIHTVASDNGEDTSAIWHSYVSDREMSSRKGRETSNPPSFHCTYIPEHSRRVTRGEIERGVKTKEYNGTEDECAYQGTLILNLLEDALKISGSYATYKGIGQLDYAV